MELFYCKSPLPNFGDDMNAWFWDEIFPDFRTLAPGRTMFGIGSILWRANVDMFDDIVVMGSGTGVGILPDRFPDATLFQFVRGPRTAREFGLPADRAISDPACCTPLLPGMEPPRAPHGDAIFVPHAGTGALPLDWARVADGAGLRLVSPSGDSRAVIREIAGARLVVTESMHGAILADAYRVPWIVVAFKPNFTSFKWLDWADSLEIPDIRIHSALDGAKRTYAALRAVRRWPGEMLARIGSRRERGGRPVRFAESDALSAAQEYRINAGEKREIRAQVARLSGLLERLLANDLARFARSRQCLSNGRVLEERQRRIFARIDEARDVLERSSPRTKLALPDAVPRGLHR